MFQAKGNAPALALCGLPLVVKKTTTKTKLTEREDYDNQWATFLMIDPVTGFAPKKWQSNVGPVLVYRPEGLDLTADDMDVTNTFLNDLLDEFGDGDFDPKSWLNPQFFQEYIRDMKEDRNSGPMSQGSKLEGLTILNS